MAVEPKTLWYKTLDKAAEYPILTGLATGGVIALSGGGVLGFILGSTALTVLANAVQLAPMKGHSKKNYLIKSIATGLATFGVLTFGPNLARKALASHDKPANTIHVAAAQSQAFPEKGNLSVTFDAAKNHHVVAAKTSIAPASKLIA